MDRIQAGQLETRFVSWPWCDREEFVTLTHWQWNYFDHLVEKHKTTPERLYRIISTHFPNPNRLWGAIYVYLDVCAEQAKAKTNALANDNSAYATNAVHRRQLTVEERAYRRLSPPMPPALPKVRWSPFKHIARARRLFPESPVQRDNSAPHS